MEEIGSTSAVSTLDWFVVAIYFAISTIGGLAFAGKQSSSEDYFVGGRKIPGWAAGLSLFATSISSTTFMAFPAQGYGGDLSRLIPHLMLPIVAIYIAFVVVPFYRRVVKISAYEYLERRFGYPARAYAALLYVLTQSFRMGFVLFLGSTAIHALTNWSLPNSIVVGGLVTLVYTTFGGVRADIWTDVIQSFVMFGGAIMCLAILLFTPEGGPAHLFEIAFDSGKLKLADLSFDLTQTTIIVMVMQGLFQYADGYTTAQASVQRYLCSPTTRQARLGVFVGAASCVLMWTMFMLIGTLLFSYYRIYPDRLPSEIADQPLKVFPHFLSTRLPNGCLGIFLAALLRRGHVDAKHLDQFLVLEHGSRFLQSVPTGSERAPNRGHVENRQLLLGCRCNRHGPKHDRGESRPRSEHLGILDSDRWTVRDVFVGILRTEGACPRCLCRLGSRSFHQSVGSARSDVRFGCSVTGAAQPQFSLPRVSHRGVVEHHFVCRRFRRQPGAAGYHETRSHGASRVGLESVRGVHLI